MKRKAKVTGGLTVSVGLVRDYLPSNYQALVVGDDIFIEGEDSHGWTLDGYVIPRLASALISVTEVVE
jgi:hypothetical protein